MLTHLDRTQRYRRDNLTHSPVTTDWEQGVASAYLSEIDLGRAHTKRYIARC